MAYTDMERRILDMWPKFEDGAYVMYEDEFEFDGEVNTAHGFIFGIGGRVSICSDKGSHVKLPNGKRVKRPAPKVLDADGVEIKVGDTVYGVGRSQHSFDVIDPHHIDPDVGEAFSVRCYDRDEHEECHCKPKLLTHTRPDSWERLERDAEKSICDYFGSSSSPGSLCEDGCPGLNSPVSCGVLMKLDLIRRAKALAEKEAAR